MDVVVILREALEQSRDSGTPFAVAWPSARLRALGAAPSPFEMTEWRAVLTDTEAAWGDAYDGRPVQPLARAAAAVAA